MTSWFNSEISKVQTELDCLVSGESKTPERKDYYWPILNAKRQAKAFIGMASYYHKSV